VDKFAGDAVMATFNATGSSLEHTTQALGAALALSGKAAMLDLELGIGIAVGPAVAARRGLATSPVSARRRTLRHDSKRPRAAERFS
jgi:class 3 adenylate cyclase